MPPHPAPDARLSLWRKGRAIAHTFEPLEARLAPAAVAVVDVHSLDGHNGFHTGDYGSADFSEMSVARVGDVNGDGLDDLLIARNYRIDQPDDSVLFRAEAFVIFGRRDGTFPANLTPESLDASTGFAIRGAPFGKFAVAGPGDMNGDGVPDIVIGATDETVLGGDTPLGEVYVIYGHRGAGQDIDLSTPLPSSAGYEIQGFGSDFGSAVAAIGDVNGDGHADIATYNPNGYGLTFVIFGSATATTGSPALDGKDGFELFGRSFNYAFGNSISAAGDVNHDGIADFIVGDSETTFGGQKLGAAFVFFGQPQFAARVSIDQLNGANGFTIKGSVPGARFGIAVSGGGDFNGDGFSDVAIGAGSDYANNANGDAVVIFGRAGTMPRTLSAAALDGRNGFHFLAEAGTSNFAETINLEGDLDGDGLADLFVGSRRYSDDHEATDLHVLYGQDHPSTRAISVTALNGINGFHVQGATAAEPANNHSLAAVGDVNGDGRDDLAFGLGRPLHILFGPSHDDATTAGLTISGDGRTASFLDTDGDLVNVQVSKGRLTPDQFTLTEAGGTIPGALQWVALDLHGDKAFNGAHLTITATPTPAGGDGHVSLESLRADGLDLSAISLAGRLGQIAVGDAVPRTPAFLSLAVDALGSDPASEEPEGSNLHSLISGNAGDLHVSGDIHAAQMRVAGALHSAQIDGSILGGSGEESGTLIVDGRLWRAVVHGDMRGGAGESSGGINAQRIDSLRIMGSLIGGAGENSGRAIAFTYLAGAVDHTVQGGDGWYSGLVGATRLGAFHVGAVQGGKGLSSGEIEGTVIDHLWVEGDVAGGGGDLSGNIHVDYHFGGAPGSAVITIGGSLLAGAGMTSGFIKASHVNLVEIQGDVRGGAIGGGLVDRVHITGSIVAGDDGRRSKIAVAGDLIYPGARPTPNRSTTGLGELRVDGDVENTDILAGYAFEPDFGYFGPLHGFTGIGRVIVKGHWLASNLVAGVSAGPDGKWGLDPATGTSDDTRLPRIFGAEKLERSAPGTIGAIVIGGSVQGTAGGADHFAFTASSIGAMRVSGRLLPLTPRFDSLPVGTAGDVTVCELRG